MSEQPDPVTPTKPSNWNVPNLLTTLRIVLVPVFGWALLHEGGESTTWRWIAFGIFSVAMITDKVDGDLARKHDLVTDFGKIADPIADKAMTGMGFIGLAIIMDTWWMWAAAIIVLVREWSVTLLRLSVMKNVVLAASWSGKVKTTMQAVALAALCAPLELVTGAWETPGEVVYALALVTLAGAVAMTLWSGWEFFRDVWRQRDALGTSTA
jgi:CDP-diacylglycerol---glycerol-3-phosphate 3-phosphatidyltransferase